MTHDYKIKFFISKSFNTFHFDSLETFLKFHEKFHLKISETFQPRTSGYIVLRREHNIGTFG